MQLRFSISVSSINCLSLRSSRIHLISSCWAKSVGSRGKSKNKIYMHNQYEDRRRRDLRRIVMFAFDSFAASVFFPLLLLLHSTKPSLSHCINQSIRKFPIYDESLFAGVITSCFVIENQFLNQPKANEDKMNEKKNQNRIVKCHPNVTSQGGFDQHVAIRH